MLQYDEAIGNELVGSQEAKNICRAMGIRDEHLEQCHFACD